MLVAMRCAPFLFAGVVLMAAAEARPADMTVVARASCPGATGQSVAAPIEEQIKGVEGVQSILSESRDDGSYIAWIRLRHNPATAPKAALIMVQNRISVAIPLLPQEVKRSGVAVAIDEPKATEPAHADSVIVDRSGYGWKALCQFSEEAAKRMSAGGAIVRAKLFPVQKDELRVCVQTIKCQARGVPVDRVVEAIQAASREAPFNIPKLPIIRPQNGDTYVICPPAFFNTLTKLRVKSTEGREHPITGLTMPDLVSRPGGVRRFDGFLAVRVTGFHPRETAAATAGERCAQIIHEEAERQGRQGIAAENLTPH